MLWEMVVTSKYRHILDLAAETLKKSEHGGKMKIRFNSIDDKAPKVRPKTDLTFKMWGGDGMEEVSRLIKRASDKLLETGMRDLDAREYREKWFKVGYIDEITKAISEDLDKYGIKVTFERTPE